MVRISPKTNFSGLKFQRVYEFLSTLYSEDFDPESAIHVSEADWAVIEFLISGMKAAISEKRCAKQTKFLREVTQKLAEKVPPDTQPLQGFLFRQFFFFFFPPLFLGTRSQDLAAHPEPSFDSPEPSPPVAACTAPEKREGEEWVQGRLCPGGILCTNNSQAALGPEGHIPRSLCPG